MGLVGGMGAKAVLNAAGARLGQISPKVWIALGCAVALLLGALWHHHEVKVTIATAKAEQKATDDAAAKAAVTKLNATIGQLTTQLRKANDDTQAANAAAANALRLSGPGRARCTAIPSAPGGHVQAPAATDAPVAQVPDAGGLDLIALPFADTIAFGQSYDDLLAEDRAWRAWHDQVLKVWPKP